MVWWNPPYCSNVKGLARKAFIIIETFLFKDNLLSRIFSKNSVKISYKTMLPLKAVITANNRRNLMNNDPSSSKKLCNCRRPDDCPVNGYCQTCEVVYSANVTAGVEKRCYTGLCARPFKERFNEHTSSFKKVKESTTLAAYVKKCQKNGFTVKIVWKIENTAKAYNGDRCKLCELEKFMLFYTDRGKDVKGNSLSLNKRSELFHKCAHTHRLRFKTEKPEKASKR